VDEWLKMSVVMINRLNFYGVGGDKKERARDWVRNSIIGSAFLMRMT
jgi:hypothetical protein